MRRRLPRDGKMVSHNIVEVNMTEKITEEGRVTIVRTVCGMRDGAMCGILAHLEGGVLKKVTPADYPDSGERGCCPKGLATPELVYHADRLRYPLKRTGNRGEGKWARVSWEEALEGIASKMQELTRNYGSNSIAWNADIAGPANLKWAGYSRLVSLSKGTYVDVVGYGDAAGPSADFATFGSTGIFKIPDGDHELLILWGYNPAATSSRAMRAIMAEKKKGTYLICIDPRFTETAAACDEHIPIRPGTDGALALAMINVILEKGLQDTECIDKFTVGPLLVRDDNGLFLRESDLVQGGSKERFLVFDRESSQVQSSDAAGVHGALIGSYSIAGIKCRPAFQLFREMVSEYSPEKASEITDVPAAAIRSLALAYATKKPAAIRSGMGMQRTFHADLAWRALNTLAAVTGNINMNEHARFVLNMQAVFQPGGPYKHIPLLKLHDAVVKGEPFPVKALWIAGENYLNQAPNTKRIVKELLPGLDLIVVADFFMTATTKYADYVLPVASFFECVELHDSYPVYTPYLQFQRKVIEPLHESKSDFRIAAALAGKMGFGEYFEKTEEEYIEELLASGHPSMEGVTLERLKNGPIRAKSPGRLQKLKTPTGRIEFYVEKLIPFGEALPVYREPLESPRSEKAGTYPLTLLSTHPEYRSGSVMANIASLTRHDPEPLLHINPEDAAPRNIAAGDVVRVFNDRGQVKLRASVDSRIKPGLVDIPQGWWPEHYIEGHHNELTHDAINPAQAAIFQPNAALNDVLVEVRKD